MDILNSNDDFRSIVIISDNEEVVRSLADNFFIEYEPLVYDTRDDFCKKIEENIMSISAIIISVKIAISDSSKFFYFMKTSTLLEAIPIIVIQEDSSDSKYLASCIFNGALEVLEYPFNSVTALNRLSNCIKLKDSATFCELECMLKELPSTIYLKDASGRYIFSTKYNDHLKDENIKDSHWSIKGKRDIDIRNDKENALIAMKSDENIIKTGVGEEYIIKEEVNGRVDYLKIIKRPVRDSFGNVSGIIALINDVTKEHMLRMSLEEKAMKDELTGVYNRHYFDLYIKEMIKIKDDELPLSFISVDCDKLKLVNDTYGHVAGDGYIRASVFAMRSAFPSNCILFRMGGDEFLIIAPGVGEKEANEYVNKLYEETDKHKVMEFTVSVSCGVATMTNSSQNIQELIKLADERMYESKRIYHRGR